MTDEAAPVATEAVPVVEPAAAPTATAETPTVAAEDVASLPEWAQKLIGKTRSEAAGNRTKANEQAQALEATRDAISKALGLKGDDDPVKAAQTAAEEREAARAVAKNLAVENAVLRMANKHGANPESLTDSRSFMRQLEAMDPADEEFSGKVGEAIAAAIEANPALKVTAPAAPPARSGAPVGGGAPVAGQLTAEDVKGMSPEAIVKAKEDGLLNNLLGITQ